MRIMGRAPRLAAAIVGTVMVVGAGVAVATTTSQSNAREYGRGIDQFGMTKGFYEGSAVDFTYTKGFWCDRSVASTASSGCEAGASWKRAPAAQHDPLYITVPLGFTVPANMQDCPSGLVCVDHPGTIDLTRLEPALKPLYPGLTDAQLTAALKNSAVPGHDHFVADDNEGAPEWWDVRIVGVTSPTVLADIRAHKSNKYIEDLIRAKNPNVVGPIPTNLFLFFGVN